MDAIELLTKQHRAVDQLCERFDTARNEERLELLTQIAEMLTIHARIEEQHFYPFARQAGLQDLVDRSIEDHTEVKRLLSDLLQCEVDDPRINGLFDQLKRSVRSHVQEEESVVFPRLTALSSADRLRELGEVMNRAAMSVPQQEVLKIARGEVPSPPAGP
ncbi:hemerythrin domain-containing protein [Archangium violaceum]|uniref:hemerythrin domain-containing protein n=1 Tax=Archangium violaceum TaxID=83451 RepID=UPI00193B21FF|nr:hemerythrin domain-containing protein [Archangium violaceum]QRK05880.1 hemerythrin domain-containing protein [Archangium violaceum]